MLGPPTGAPVCLWPPQAQLPCLCLCPAPSLVGRVRDWADGWALGSRSWPPRSGCDSGRPRGPAEVLTAGPVALLVLWSLAPTSEGSVGMGPVSPDAGWKHYRIPASPSSASSLGVVREEIMVGNKMEKSHRERKRPSAPAGLASSQHPPKAAARFLSVCIRPPRGPQQSGRVRGDHRGARGHTGSGGWSPHWDRPVGVEARVVGAALTTLGVWGSGCFPERPASVGCGAAGL